MNFKQMLHFLNVIIFKLNIVPYSMYDIYIKNHNYSKRVVLVFDFSLLHYNCNIFIKTVLR